MHLANKEKLMNDLRMVIADTEELLRMSAGQVDEGAEGIRTRVTARLHQATTELSQLYALNSELATKDVTKLFTKKKESLYKTKN